MSSRPSSDVICIRRSAPRCNARAWLQRHLCLQVARCGCGRQFAERRPFSERPELNVDDTRLIDTGISMLARSRNRRSRRPATGTTFTARAATSNRCAAAHRRTIHRFLRWLVCAGKLGAHQRRANLQSLARRVRGAEKNRSLVAGPFGIGASESAARYSDLDLNDNAGVFGATEHLPAVSRRRTEDLDRRPELVSEQHPPVHARLSTRKHRPILCQRRQHRPEDRCGFAARPIAPSIANRRST